MTSCSEDNLIWHLVVGEKIQFFDKTWCINNTLELFLDIIALNFI